MVVANAFCEVSETGMCGEKEKLPKEKEMTALGWVLSGGYPCPVQVLPFAVISTNGQSCQSSSHQAGQTAGSSEHLGWGSSSVLTTERHELLLTTLGVPYWGLLHTALMFQHQSRALFGKC